MAEIDVNAYATTATNTAATAPSIVETQQPGGTGALRQVLTIGDPTTRANMAKVDAAGNVAVSVINTPNTISVNNSTTVVLAANGVFTGPSDDMTNFRSISCYIETDSLSATNGVAFQFSSDNVNWSTWSANTLLSTPSTFFTAVVARYFRIVYTNSATAQTTFRMQTILYPITFAGQIFDTSKDGLNTATSELSTRGKIFVYNGTTWDRVRSATSAAATTGIGLAGAGILGFDGTNYQRIKTDTSGQPILGAGGNSIGSVTTNPTISVTSNSQINSAATTNATNIKAAAGNLYSITISNVGAAAAFVKLYNTSVAPTPGTTTIALTIPVPASGVVNIPFGTQGLRFSVGISLAITNLVADTDATAVAAGQVKVLTSYI